MKDAASREIPKETLTKIRRRLLPSRLLTKRNRKGRKSDVHDVPDVSDVSDVSDVPDVYDVHDVHDLYYNCKGGPQDVRPYVKF